MAIKQGWVEEAQKKLQPPWQIHIHRAEDAASIGAVDGPVVDPSLGKNLPGDMNEDDIDEEDECPSA